MFQNGDTPLNKAISNNRSSDALLFINSGADVNIKNNVSMITPYHVSLRYKRWS